MDKMFVQLGSDSVPVDDNELESQPDGDFSVPPQSATISENPSPNVETIVAGSEQPEPSSLPFPVNNLASNSTASLPSSLEDGDRKEMRQFDAEEPSSPLSDSLPEPSNLTDSAGCISAQRSSALPTEREISTDGSLALNERHEAAFDFTALRSISGVQCSVISELEIQDSGAVWESTEDEGSDDITDSDEMITDSDGGSSGGTGSNSSSDGASSGGGGSDGTRSYGASSESMTESEYQRNVNRYLRSRRILQAIRAIEYRVNLEYIAFVNWKTPFLKKMNFFSNKKK